ncbi:MAG: bile acid:sodium symporter [Thermomicrobiales bacterium]
MMTESLHSISEVAITAGVFTAMMAAGTSVPIGAVWHDLHERRLVALALLGNLVLMPLLALGITKVMPVTGDARNALILLGICAGVPMMTKLTALSKGERPFSIGIMMLLMVSTVILAPLLVPLMLQEVTVTSWDIAGSLSVVMLLPLAGGLVARQRYPELKDVSEMLAHIARPCMAIGITAGVIAAWRDLVGTLGSWMLVSTIVLGLGGLAIGWLLGWNSPPGDRQVLALGTGMRNFSAALLIAGRDFDPDTLVMTSAGAFMLMLIMTVVAGEIGRTVKRAAPATASVPPASGV